VLQVNAAETSLQYRNIFLDREYQQHGVHIPPGAVVFDVGANVGIATLFFLAEQPDARVFAFEPAAVLFRALQRNLETERDRATALPYALGNAVGRRSLTYYPRTTAMSSFYADPADDAAVTKTFLANCGFSESDINDMVFDGYVARTESCVVSTVSHQIAAHGIETLHLLKINVEKAEADVLAGIDELDWPRIQQIVMQVHDIDGRLAGVRGDLHARGFQVFTRQSPLLYGTPIHDLAARRA
jgi:31-O-methyltransferase